VRRLLKKAMYKKKYIVIFSIFVRFIHSSYSLFPHYYEKSWCKKWGQSYIVRAEARFRNRCAGIEFRVKERPSLPFFISKHGNQEETTWTRPIYQMIAIHRESWTEYGILVYRAARGDFRSIKVTFISSLIRSRSKSQRDDPRFLLRDDW